MTPLIISVTPGNYFQFSYLIQLLEVFRIICFLANIEMLNRINQSLTEKKENLIEEPKYDEQKYEDLWNKTMFNDTEFWFLKTG